LVYDLKDCYKLGMVLLLDLDDIPLLFIDKCIQSNYVLKSNLNLFDQRICYINCSFNIDTKLLND
jgi:hypothetical protein